ncbi:hypothetical protein Cs7R123_43810 [Catellatospora sp. TT07R-123]|uniref:DUF1775 domain-containing protein n=1 Tax=Catellatospora sp. TT07R-123 TaxID=2733863 RepID=UPI001B092A06|nr:DUF1775 domain-containing protein [Catellatospora sp. TT07R-123]GHJ47039.1 hypothetical protein Cs7R123_43810 [Catellatospora sp. TT07R-123]
MLGRVLGRVAVVAAAGAVAVAVMALPASAHTEIELKPAQAGATNATLKVNAEAESDAAGIKSVQMVLPEGITPAEVTLASGPAGWALKPTGDGFTVAGPALRTGTDAAFTVTLAQLPAAATVLVFKTLVTYGNGDVDRWIGAASDSNPAPFVSLKPAAASPSAVPSASALAPTGSAAASPQVSASAAADSASPSNTGWIATAVVVALLVAGAAVWLVRRGRSGTAS